MRGGRETTKNMSYPGRPAVTTEKRILQLLTFVENRGKLEDVANISGIN